MRLIKFLKNKYKNYGSRELKRALEKGACLVNGKIERFGTKIIDPTKDKIEFREIEFKARPKLTIKNERIIYEDNHLLIYNKEAGYSSLPTEGKNTNLLDELKKIFENKISFQPVHRLDKDTSGLIIFAKDSETVRIMNEMFQAKKIKKEYLAITDGNWDKSENGTIDNYLCLEYKRGAMQKWKVADIKKDEPIKNKSKYKHAITKYQVLKKLKNLSLVKLEPKTGRTHQLRVHLSFIGYPILGDTVYAKSFKSNLIPGRHLLHAYLLEFNHPITNSFLRIEAPIPEEIKFLIE